MRMLSGYLEPSDGSILIDSVNPAGDSRSGAATPRLSAGKPADLPRRVMVWPYLDYVATLKGIPAPRRMAAVREALLATDLAAQALAPIHILSRGFRQRPPPGCRQAISGTTPVADPG
ncbi:MAG: hypothetical protein IPG64_18670 [Haliea sp.]|nr:hypothetical protein [Haliea sp.]